MYKKTAVTELKAKKIKVTPQRLAIMEFLESGCIHPSAEEIYTKLKKQYPSLSLATVYNTLEALVGSGTVRRLMLGAKHAKYEYQRGRHDHFICRSCGLIIDVPAGEARTAFVSGHKVEYAERYYMGICRDCLLKNNIRNK